MNENNLKVAQSKQYVGLIYLNKDNQFLTPAGYTKLKKHYKSDLCTKKLANAKTFKFNSVDPWALSNSSISNWKLESIFLLEYKALQLERPWRGDIFTVGNGTVRYLILEVNLHSSKKTCFELLCKKLEE